MLVVVQHARHDPVKFLAQIVGDGLPVVASDDDASAEFAVLEGASFAAPGAASSAVWLGVTQVAALAVRAVSSAAVQVEQPERAAAE